MLGKLKLKIANLLGMCCLPKLYPRGTESEIKHIIQLSYSLLIEIDDRATVK